MHIQFAQEVISAICCIIHKIIDVRKDRDTLIDQFLGLARLFMLERSNRLPILI